MLNLAYPLPRQLEFPGDFRQRHGGRKCVEPEVEYLLLLVFQPLRPGVNYLVGMVGPGRYLLQGDCGELRPAAGGIRVPECLDDLPAQGGGPVFVRVRPGKFDQRVGRSPAGADQQSKLLFKVSRRRRLAGPAGGPAVFQAFLGAFQNAHQLVEYEHSDPPLFQELGSAQWGVQGGPGLEFLEYFLQGVAGPPGEREFQYPVDGNSGWHSGPAAVRFHSFHEGAYLGLLFPGEFLQVLLERSPVKVVEFDSGPEGLLQGVGEVLSIHLFPGFQVQDGAAWGAPCACLSQGAVPDSAGGYSSWLIHLMVAWSRMGLSARLAAWLAALLAPLLGGWLPAGLLTRPGSFWFMLGTFPSRFAEAPGGRPSLS